MGLIFSDLHLDNYSQFSTIVENGLNSRLYEQIKVVHTLCGIIKKESISDVYFLGDLFNSLNESMPKIIYQVAFDLVKLLQENCNLFMIVGNHDIYQKIHLFTPFRSLPNVRVAYKPAYITALGHRVAIYPWNTFVRPKKSYDLLLGHFGIRGAEIGSGVRNLDKEIPVEDLKGMGIVVAGHYHTMQQVYTNIHHVGSVMAHKFSDPGVHGYFIVNGNRVEPHYLTSPNFVKIRINTKGDLDKFLKERNFNDYYQLQLTDYIDTPEFDHKVVISYIVDKDIADHTIDIPETKTFMQSVNEFIEKSLTAVDKDLAKKYAEQIIREQMKGEEL